MSYHIILIILGSQPGVMFEFAQGITNPQPEKIHVTPKMGNGFARKIEQERKPPDLVTNVSGDNFHFSDVGIGDAKL